MGSVSQVQQLGHGDSDRETLVEVSNLNVVFSKKQGTFRKRAPRVHAVRDVSLRICKSEILSLVGESGSGKTTMAKCLMGLLRPTGGSIRYGGRDVTAFGERELIEYWHDVQMIYQDPFESLYPRFDVLTTLSIPIRRLAGTTDTSKIRDAASSLIEEVGLDPQEVLQKLPHQLSGGERQRVSIAKALAPNPKLLIADEPITMLDASQRLNILSLLMELKETRKLTILLITHDLASTKILSDRTAIMYLGRLVAIGPTLPMLSNPHHPYAELILS